MYSPGAVGGVAARGGDCLAARARHRRHPSGARARHFGSALAARVTRCARPFGHCAGTDSAVWVHLAGALLDRG